MFSSWLLSIWFVRNFLRLHAFALNLKPCRPAFRRASISWSTSGRPAIRGLSFQVSGSGLRGLGFSGLGLRVYTGNYWSKDGRITRQKL